MDPTSGHAAGRLHVGLSTLQGPARRGTSTVCARVCVCMYVFLCVFICMKVYACACVRACVRACDVCTPVCDCSTRDSDNERVLALRRDRWKQWRVCASQCYHQSLPRMTAPCPSSRTRRASLLAAYCERLLKIRISTTKCEATRRLFSDGCACCALWETTTGVYRLFESGWDVRNCSSAPVIYSSMLRQSCPSQTVSVTSTGIASGYVALCVCARAHAGIKMNVHSLTHSLDHARTKPSTHEGISYDYR